MMAAAPARILFLTDQLSFGGAERHLVALAGTLAARGHTVSVASLKEGGELGPALACNGIHSVRCCRSRGGLDVAAIGRLARIIDERNAQVVVATSQYSLMFGVLARMRAQRRCALAFICHSMGVVQRGGAARLRFLVYRQFYGRADTVIFVSELQRRYFAAMGIVPRHSEVVHNGIDLHRFAAAAVAQQGVALRQECRFAAHELVIGMCAAFREEKRQVDMLEALARLRRQGVPARLLLAGDGPMRTRIEACRDRLGLGGAVVLAGFQDDVRPAIAACDVMALTSHTETFPIATLEYMAMGKALVASDVGGLREQVDDGDNGLLYPAGDVSALAAALGRCAEPALRARLAGNALDTVHRRFGLERMVAHYEGLFGALAGAPAQAATGTHA